MYTPVVSCFSSPSILVPRTRPSFPPFRKHGYYDLASADNRHVNKHNPEEMPPVPQVTLRRMLLTTIHGYYLQALAWLPKDQLCSHYHHSLLQAGHCYGPLDPVSNIIVNTLWYAQVYPLVTLEEKVVEIEAISTKPLLRIAVRSLYSLISYLCTRYPALTPSEATLRLHQAGAHLQKALLDPSLPDDGGGVLEAAYLAAAKAARHPEPRQQALFLGPSNSRLSALSELFIGQEPAIIRGFLLQYFQTLVPSSIKPEKTTNNSKALGARDYSMLMVKRDRFWNQHKRAVGMVKSAIDMYNKQHDGVSKYELHVICGVNEFVGGPLLTAPPGRAHRFSHINFLATQTTAGARPELFFAECRKVGSKGGLGFCCPVAMPLPATEQPRCPYCELAGNRIVHPAKESFRGRDRELEKMLAREGVYAEEDINDHIISGSIEKTLCVGYLQEDEIYNNYHCDNNIVEEFPMYEFY